MTEDYSSNSRWGGDGHRERDRDRDRERSYGGRGRGGGGGGKGRGGGGQGTSIRFYAAQITENDGLKIRTTLEDIHNRIAEVGVGYVAEGDVCEEGELYGR